MKKFWGFYQNLNNIKNPFCLFGVEHLLYVLIVFITICLLMKKYKKFDMKKKINCQRVMACYFLVEEFIYYSWIAFNCKENIVFELISLEMCTFCAWMNASTYFHQNKQIRFFSVIVGMFGGLVAMIYPANVIDIYPAVSYRLINFYMLHGAFVLFSLMLLDEKGLLNRNRLKKNMVIVACMFGGVFCFNLIFHTQYMFVGIPPNIPIIYLVYELCGKLLFLPMVILAACVIQAILYLIIKKVQEMLYFKQNIVE